MTTELIDYIRSLSDSVGYVFGNGLQEIVVQRVSALQPGPQLDGVGPQQRKAFFRIHCAGHLHDLSCIVIARMLLLNRKSFSNRLASHMFNPGQPAHSKIIKTSDKFRKFLRNFISSFSSWTVWETYKLQINK